MKRARVLIADDHTILAEGLRGLLEPQFEVVGIAEDGRSLLAAAQELHPDVVVLDISMPLLNGIEAARQLRKHHPGVHIVFLTMHPDVALIKEAFRTGARAYVLKRAASSELVTAIREVLRGRAYLTPLVTKDTLDSLLAEAARPERSLAPLTARQREVLQLLAEGRSVKEIAAILNVATKTVEFHKYSIMDQLGLRTIAELTQYAIKHRIVSV